MFRNSPFTSPSRTGLVLAIDSRVRYQDMEHCPCSEHHLPYFVKSLEIPWHRSSLFRPILPVKDRRIS